MGLLAAEGGEVAAEAVEFFTESGPWILRNAWVFFAIPAASFFAILLVGKRLPGKGSWIGTLSIASTFGLGLWAVSEWVRRTEAVEESEGVLGALAGFGRSLLAAAEGGEKLPVVPAVTNTYTWFQSGGLELTAGTYVDGLSVMMIFVVTTISLLVHIYSTAYMRGDERFTYYYAALSLFSASMLLLVVAENTLLLLVGWELVGLCSFMLIGHWWEEKENSNAAIKAFLTTRTGDIGLLVGVVMTFFVVQSAFGAGSFSIAQLNVAALSGDVSSTLLYWTAMALLLAIIGKSGQFPLHTWLPDAMAGPTPVSALIHAATMVVAGVYLGARVYPVFYEGFSIELGGVNPMILIGGITIIIGALLAFVQRDIKKVLAYSTISQLGYMVMGLGAGAWTAAVFHLFTHAFFKALLFLGAGSISHAGTHHSFDMKADMGGLRKPMPITFWTFMIGTLALAGVFPLAGFWSKDEILANASENGFEVFLWVGMIGAFLTAAYMARCVYLTFFGQYRGHAHPRESEPAITVPLVILAGFAVVAGWLQFVPGFELEKFKEWVEPRAVEVFFPAVDHAAFSYTKAAISLLLIAGGLAAGWLYTSGRLGFLQGLTQRFAPARVAYVFLEKKYYLDWLYTDVIVGFTKGALARASYWVNQNVLDGVVNGVGRGTAVLGRGVYEGVDQAVVDGAVNGIGEVTGDTGGVLRVLQSGRVQRYALILFGAVVVLGGALVLVN